jgi:hypothetical protein
MALRDGASSGRLCDSIQRSAAFGPRQRGSIISATSVLSHRRTSRPFLMCDDNVISSESCQRQVPKSPWATAACAIGGRQQHSEILKSQCHGCHWHSRVLSHVETIGNAGSGISVPNAIFPFGGLTISDSDSTHNAGDGVGCPGSPVTTGTLIWVIRSTVVGNAGAGLNGARCFINVRGSTLHSNASGNFAGTTFSFGDNVAGDDESVPTGSNAFQ